MKRLLAILSILFVLALAGCATAPNSSQATLDSQQIATKATNVVKQLPGVVAALGEAAQAAPVDAKTKAQIAETVNIASAAASVVASVSSSTSTQDAIVKVGEAAKTVNDTVQASSADTNTKTQVANYAGWAMFALKLAAVILPAVL